MRAQVTFEHVILSDGGMNVTIVDNPDNETPTVVTYFMQLDDPEYRLLTQAIDRFAAVQKLKTEEKK